MVLKHYLGGKLRGEMNTKIKKSYVLYFLPSNPISLHDARFFEKSHCGTLLVPTIFCSEGCMFFGFGSLLGSLPASCALFFDRFAKGKGKESCNKFILILENGLAFGTNKNPPSCLAIYGSH